MIDVVVIGASVRALAMSALRAGLRPWCADLFADADLRAIAPTRQLPISDYPQGFRSLLADAPLAPVIITGGLENDPDLLAAIARDRPLWGSDASSIRRVRYPFTLSQWLREAGLPTLEVYRTFAEIPTGMRCLRKPLRGSAGLHIRFADAAGGSDIYFQQFVRGGSYSALYRDAEWIATTEQLVDGFRYAGTIAPQAGPRILQQIGEIIVERAGLRGLWGIDYVLAEGVPWVVEVNPRYTAAMEVIELATGHALLGPGLPKFDDMAPTKMVGKQIVYAMQPCTFAGIELPPFEPWRIPAIADVPDRGVSFEPGQPILTVFASAASSLGVRDSLLAASAAIPLQAS